MAQSLFLLPHQPAMLFVQSILGAKRAHLVMTKDREIPPPHPRCAPLIFLLFIFSPPSLIILQLVNVCLCVGK